MGLGGWGWGLGFRVWSLAFGVWGLGVEGLGPFRAFGFVEFRRGRLRVLWVSGLGLRVEALVCRL